MLGKMYAYDIKALSRTLIPIHLGLLLVGFVCAVAGISGYLSNEYDYLIDAVAPESSQLVMGLAALMCGLCILLMLSAVVATFVIVLVRFYKNLFTDEGYLTLTLPLTAWQQVMSKVLAGMTWMLIDALVVMLCLTAFSFASEGLHVSSYDDLLPLWILRLSGSGLAFADLGQGFHGIAYVLGLCLSAVLQMLFVLMLAYASFCIGATVAAKHKVAAGVGMFIGTGWAYSLITGFFSVGLALNGVLSWQTTMDILNVITTVIEIGVIVGGWFLCVWILKSKVNLA